MLFITHDEFWRNSAVEVGRPTGWPIERFATMAARRANRERVLAAIAELLATDTVLHWVARLAPLGVVVPNIESLEDALASELTRSRDMVIELPCAEGRLQAVGAAIKYSGGTPHFGTPPLLDEHGAEFGVARR